MTHANKRKDIQWLRAFAIIAVLCFHLWPEYFPHGYLGVDIFFVISGYLMTMILENSSELFKFYLRRVKRIFPTYFLVITVFLVIGNFILLSSHFEFLKQEALWSIFFVNNFYPMFHEKQYFELVSEFNFFVHTWSLGVEIQFYLIAPFLITFILSKEKPVYWTLFFGITSWLLQCFIPNKSVSFGLVFCRIWQFVIGTGAYCISKYQNKDYSLLSQKAEEDQQVNFEDTPNIYQNNISLLSFFFLGLMTFFPISILHIYLVPFFIRLICTIFTGIFVISNTLQPISLPKRLNFLLVYIGNASYVIYLIHWPIIIYLRYFAIDENKLYTLIFIFVVGFIVHEFFEKPLGNNTKISFAVIFICFLIISALYSGFFFQNSDKPLVNDPIKANEEEAKSCLTFDYPECVTDPIIEKYFIVPKPTKLPNPLFRYCSIKLNNHSNNTIMITGNSYIYFAIRGFMEAIKQSKMKFSKVYFICRPACVLIAGALNQKIKSSPLCSNFDKAHGDLLKVVKPNIIIHFSRLEFIPTFGDFPMKNTAKDPAMQEIKKTLLHITNFTQRLIIIEPNPYFKKFGYKSPLSVAQAILTNSSLSKFDVSTKQHHKLNDPSWNRVLKAVKSCPKCVTIPTEKIFCSKTICPAVDPQTKLAMYCDLNHLTPRTSMKLTSSLLKAIDF